MVYTLLHVGGAPEGKQFLALVPAPGGTVPHTHVHHGPPTEKLFLKLVTIPGPPPVPHTHVRHGPSAEKLFL